MSDFKKTFVYIGNWNKTPVEHGFGICRYNTETGEPELIKSVFDEISVGATCIDSRRNILYCTNEIATYPGYFSGGGGQVYAFAVDPETGDLTKINHQPSYGTFPSYVAVDAIGGYLLVVNHTDHTPITRSIKDTSEKYRISLEYDDATTVLYRLNDDGSIGDPCDIYKHSGNGPLPKQSHPQLHSVMMSPSGNLFAACDKGGDQIFFFRINRQENQSAGARQCNILPGVAMPRLTSPEYPAASRRVFRRRRIKIIWQYSINVCINKHY